MLPHNKNWIVPTVSSFASAPEASGYYMNMGMSEHADAVARLFEEARQAREVDFPARRAGGAK